MIEQRGVSCLKRLIVVLAVLGAGAVVSAGGVSGQEAGEPDFTIGEVNFERIADQCAPETRQFDVSRPDCPDMFEIRTFTGDTDRTYRYRDGTYCVGSPHVFTDTTTGHFGSVAPGRYRVWADDGGWGGRWTRDGQEGN